MLRLVMLILGLLGLMVQTPRSLRIVIGLVSMVIHISKIPILTASIMQRTFSRNPSMLPSKLLVESPFGLLRLDGLLVDLRRMKLSHHLRMQRLIGMKLDALFSEMLTHGGSLFKIPIQLFLPQVSVSSDQL